MAIDGSAGPGTDRAVRSYLRAFDVRSFDFTEENVAALELAATSGFRSATELNRAAARGFSTREEMQTAEAAGYSSMPEYEEGQRLGVANAAEYRSFKRSGFDQMDAYRQALGNGFERREDQERAQAAGFINGDEYRAFLASGEEDKEAYLDLLAEQQMLAEYRDLCISRAEGRSTAIACAEALAVAGDDRRVRDSYSSIRDEILAELALKKTQLEADIAEREGGNSNSTLAMRIQLTERRVADLSGAAALAECVLGASTDLSSADLAGLEATCDAAISAFPDVQGARTSLVRVNDIQTKRQEEAVRAQQAIALENGRRDARELLDRIEQFNAEGGRFSDAVQVARVVLNLRTALGTDDADSTVRALNAAQEITTADVAFTGFLARAELAERQARADAIESARVDLERYSAFLESYVSGNLLDPNTPDYLALLERITRALTSGGGEALTLERAAAVNELRNYGLLSDAEAFELEVEKQAEEQTLAEVGTAVIVADRAKGQAQNLLSDVRRFAESGGSFDNPLEVARAINGLMQSLEGSGTLDLDSAMVAANAAFGTSDEFSAFRAEQEALRNAGISDAMAVSEARARAINDYIVASLSRNPFDPNLPTLLEIQGDLDRVLSEGNGPAITASQERAVSILNGLGLSAEIDAVLQGAEIEVGSDTTEVSVTGLSITALNREVLEGNPEDILLLENRTLGAPNMRRNLRGDIVFEQGQLALCWAHPVPARTAAVRMALDGLRDIADVQSISIEQCTAGGYLSSDIVALRRGDFLELPANVAAGVVALFEDKELSVLRTLEWSEVSARVEEYQETSRAIREEVEAGVRSGLGYISFDFDGAAFCVVGSDSYEPRVAAFHSELYARDLRLHLPEVKSNLFDSAELIFARTRRGECSVLQVDAIAMADFLGALDRERIPFTVAPIWATEEELDRIAAAFAADDASTAERLAEMAQEVEAKRQADIERYNIEDGERRDRQAAMRAQFSQEARAAQDDLASLLAPTFDTENPQTSNIVRQMFPDVTAWAEQNRTALWEYEGHSVTLIDYGTAGWMGRQLEAVVIEVVVNTFNRPMGARNTECFLLGYLIDAEFEMRRDPVFAQCSDAGGFVQDWMAGRGFESRWIAK